MTTDARAASVDNLFGAEPVAAPSQAPELAPAPSAYQPIETHQTPAVEPQPVAIPVAPAPEPVQQPQHQVPLAHLIEERKRAQAAERERSQLLEAVARLTAQQQQAPQPVYQRPDPISDPEGAYAHLEHKVQQGFLNQHLNMSERYARTTHGSEVVDQALEAAQRAGYDAMFVNRPDPYGEMVDWYRGQQVAQEIGTDPAAYRARIEAEVATRVRAEVMAQLQAGRTPPQNLPPSLSTSTNASGGVEHVPSAKDHFNSMMSNHRTPNRG